MITKRKLIFGRMTRIAVRKGATDSTRRKVIICVEALNKDHAIRRLGEKYPHVAALDWDFIEEVDPACDFGKLGETLPWNWQPEPAKKLH